MDEAERMGEIAEAKMLQALSRYEPVFDLKLGALRGIARHAGELVTEAVRAVEAAHDAGKGENPPLTGEEPSDGDA